MSDAIVPTGTTMPAPHAGRPPLEIDQVEFQKLVAMGCTTGEIAEFFGCSRKTIQRRLNDPEDLTLRQAWERGRSQLKLSLRRLQFKYAQGDGVNGAAAVNMLIHLSKHQLGEIEKQVHQNPDGSAMGAGRKEYVVLLPHNGRDPLPPPEEEEEDEAEPIG